MPSSSAQVNALKMLGFQAAQLGAQNLDLTALNAEVFWDVTSYTQARINIAGSNAVAVLTVKKSSDGGSNYVEFNPRIRITGSGVVEGIPVASANRLKVYVSTIDAGGTTEEASCFADQGEPTSRLYQLGQLRPASTTAASLYTPSVSGTVRSLVVCNTSGADATCRIFHDEDGATYDQTTALYYDVTVYGDRPPLILNGLEWGVQEAGNIGVRTSVNDALTFTAYGTEP